MKSKERKNIRIRETNKFDRSSGKSGSRGDRKAKKTVHLSTLTIIALSITVVTAVAVSAVSFAASYNAALMRDASTNSEQAVNQVSATVTSYLLDLNDKLTKLCAEIASCNDVSEIESKSSIAVRLEKDIEAVVVYDADGNILACGSNGKELKHDLSENLSYDKKLFSNADDYALSIPHVQNIFNEYYPWVVTIVHREYQEIFGGDVYVAIDFGFSNIAEYIDKVGIGQHGYCYITDSDGNIVYHPQQQMIFSGIKSEDTESIKGYSDGVHTKNSTIYSLNTLRESGWRIVGISYTDEFRSSRTRTVLGVIVLSLFCCVVVAVLILVRYSKIVTRPVRELANAMKEFECDADAYKYRPEHDHVAELQTLSDSFGHMVCMIQDLMGRVRAEETTLRKTELKALQAQINPHFLYNTLDSIQWMCEQGKNDDAIKMVGALARLFRISISRGHELITIRDELRHAESYMLIQSYRYRNRFEYEFNVDSSVENCLCNKITVQPLIENAIYHGIEPLVDKGKITITVRRDGEDILIEVADNGVGMTEEQCESILRKERSDSSGIGIKNVNDRLRIYFGDKYGISVKSELDCGTTITVRIPQIWKEPDGSEK